MSRILLSLVAFSCIWNGSVVMAHDECCQQGTNINISSNDVAEEGFVGVEEDDIWKSEADEEKFETLSEQDFDSAGEGIASEEVSEPGMSSVEEELGSDETESSPEVAPSAKKDYGARCFDEGCIEDAADYEEDVDKEVVGAVEHLESTTGSDDNFEEEI